MKKSVLFIMFLLCMAWMLFPCTAYAEDYPMSGTCGENLTWKLEQTEEEDGYVYTLLINGTGDMTGGGNSYGSKWYWARGSIGRIVIEDGVTSICGLGGALVQNVTIPNSVTTIDGSAFAGCTALTDIEIPDSVKEIGSNAFAGCTALTDIIIPDSVTAIWTGAFHHCTSLKNIIIPESVKEIKYGWKEKGIFEGCSSLERVKIGNGLTEIGTAMFKDCGSLTDILIPDSVTRISTEAFYNCSSLKNIIIPESVTFIAGEWSPGDGSVEYGAFDGCSSLMEIAIPKSVTNIGEHAFRNCASLERVDISNSAAKVEGSTFGGCENLSEFAVNSDNSVYSVENGILFSRNKKKLICFPQGRAGSYQIPDNVTALGECAFYGCGGLEHVAIPDSVVSMGNGTFYRCGLTEVEIPHSIEYISNSAFALCESLESVVIQNGVKTIGSGAFDDCYGITNIIIPDGVKWIYSDAFNSCRNLTSITIPGSVQQIKRDAFLYSENLTDVYYAKGEADWDSITEGYIGFSESSVTMHYNSRGDFSCFQSPSTTYDNRLALIAADMSEKAEQGEDAIRALYKSYGISDCECYNFDESAAFAIGHKTMTVNGVETTVLVITARGTETNEEKIGDWLKGFPFDKTREFLGQAVWTHVYEFEEKIAEGLNSYVVRYPNLEEADNLKILVTGHSLGGAAANMVATRFTRFAEWGGWWSEAAGKEDIYAYTFGAIKVIDEENKNISDGYENIHNIYNYYDSFGPNGNMGLFNASAIKAKFGHTELYYLREDEKLTSCNNHLMSNYKKALEQNKVSCSERAKEKRKNRIEKMEKQLSGIWQSVKRVISQIAVLCPVDVEIYASDGSLAGSVVDNEIEKMLPDKVYICTEGDKKYIYLLDDDSYTVKLKGTDAGTMTYSVQNINMDAGEIMEEKTFTDVSLASGKQFSGSVTVEENSVVGIEDDSVKLFVVKEDGEPEKEVLADGNGTEAAIEEEPGKPENPDKPGTGGGTDKPGGSNTGNKNPNKGKPDEKNPDDKTPSIKINGIKISGISKKIAAGKKITLKAAVSPSNAANKSLAWKSGNKKYATVNSKGVVTLKKAGAGKTVTITASAKDGSEKKASYKIKIMKGIVKDVKISGKATRVVKSGTSLKLKASVKASKGANKALQWKSDNTKYASVNGKGKVTLKKAGKGKTVKITAMATDGSGRKAVVKIKIK